MKELLILRINGVKIDDVGDGQALLRLRQQLDGIAGSKFTFGDYGKVEAGSTATQKAFYDVWSTESDANPRWSDSRRRVPREGPFAETLCGNAHSARTDKHKRPCRCPMH